MDYGYHAWMLVAASLVILMTAPGLALFYGGMSRSKSVLNMMMMSFGTIGIAGIVYVLWGWSMSFGTEDVAMIFNNPFETFGLEGVSGQDYIFVGFQLTFAVITAALISGAVADRLKFSAWMLFVPLWLTLSYFPMAHMVWGGGFLGSAANGISGLLFDGDPLPIDYAGGTVVHINAGMAGLVLALMLGKRIGFGKEPIKPHNLTLTMIGAGLLWFGWYGFNVGSIVFTGESAEADAAQFLNETSLVWLNTTRRHLRRDPRLAGDREGPRRQGHLARRRLGRRRRTGGDHPGLWRPVAARLDRPRPDRRWRRAPSPSGLKYRFGYDDALDVVGVHLVGGLDRHHRRRLPQHQHRPAVRRRAARSSSSRCSWLLVRDALVGCRSR